MTRFLSRPLLLLITTVLLAVAVLVVQRTGNVSSATLQEEPLGQTDTTPNSCRYGTSGIGTHANFVDDMRLGWIIDFGARPPSPIAGVEYMPTVRIEQQRDGSGARINAYNLVSPPSMAALETLVSNNPGLVWQIGNEVDRYQWQDDLWPQAYAKAYHDIYYTIKANDPTAQVAPSALVEVTPGRLQYLDIVWNEYRRLYGEPMPVDVWNMHIYILPEAEYDQNGNLVYSRAGIALGTDPSLAILFSGGNPALCGNTNVYCYAEHDDINIFIEQVVAMRTWMKVHGQQNKPLILTEFGTLYPYREASDPPEGSCDTCYSLKDEYGNVFDRTRVTNFMNATLDYLENAADPALGYPDDNYRLVQQWNWYAIQDGSPFFSSNLVQDDGSVLTPMGQTYKARNIARGFDINLRLSQTYAIPVWSGGGTATARLTATIRNNGNVPTQGPVKVTFASDAGMNNIIGEVEIPAGIMGCATRPYTVSVDWPGLTPGLHRYWVEIDKENAIPETVEQADNRGTSFVLVDPQQMLLPRLTR